jgi:hypothetical protein
MSDAELSRTVETRILPGAKTKLTTDPRVKFLGKDPAGFTRVEAQLKPGQGVCWKCGGIADDNPEGTLQTCPHCGGSFND